MGKKALASTVVPKNDTRGLPQGMDPRMFYVYSSQLREQTAEGVEKFLYKLMPVNLIGSLAFALDPLSQFKVSATRISPATRTRTRIGTSILDNRSITVEQVTKIAPYQYLPGGYSGESKSTYEVNPQKSIPHVSQDIVASDRLPGSDMGEFSMWKANAFSSPRSINFHEHERRFYAGYPSGGYWYIYTKDYRRSVNGSSAYITKTTVDALRGDVQGRQLAQMQANVLSLYRRTSSQKRATTLFRNTVELKDLPRSIIQLRDTALHLRYLAEIQKIPKTVLERIHSFRTTGYDIPKEFLSYSFGWRQLYSDIGDLLASPERIAKRVNFLLRRNGKATTYRSQLNVSENYATTSGFSYDALPSEGLNITSHSVSMDHALKMVINATFEFPDVNAPRLREKEFYRQLGVVPTPIDVYNLVPWTWLVDWFTGFGKYLEVIESINTDKELINWGVFTCKTTGSLSSTYASRVQNAESYGGEPTVFSYPVFGHTSILEFTSQLRRDVSGMLNVRTTGDPSTLTTYQQSILGALLVGRLKF